MTNPVIVTPRYYYQNESLTTLLIPTTTLMIEVSDDSGVVQTLQ